MQRYVIFAKDEYYHIYNRGNDKQKIFLDSKDYERFLTLLYLSNSYNAFKLRRNEGRSLLEHMSLDRGETLVDICAYCIMPNHFHILIKEKIDGGIPIFMRKLATGYSMYFNKRYERTGKLFENTYKAEHADTDNYLKYLFSYIHLNPVKLVDPAWRKNGIKDFKDSYNFLNSYEYSSYLDYLQIERKIGSIINKNALPKYFDSKEAIEKEIFDWLTYSDRVK